MSQTAKIAGEHLRQLQQHMAMGYRHARRLHAVLLAQGERPAGMSAFEVEMVCALQTQAALDSAQIRGLHKQYRSWLAYLAAHHDTRPPGEP